MLFKISLSNLRKSMRDYAIYFFTLMIGVSIFYVFNAIGTQTAYMKVSNRTNEIIELLTGMLSGVSVLVSLVLGFLIVYASRFLMKRRNKEFALYLMLGMGKGKISAILLMETLMIGAGSLFVGLVAGIGISQLMSALVANLFEADMTAYRFTVSGGAIVKTIVYFGIIYLIVMLFNSGMVSKYKLIDLMQSGRKSEELKLKNPTLCVIVFLLSAAALGYAYHYVSDKSMSIEANAFMLMVAIGAAATFFLFWSVAGLLLRIVMSMKKTYFRGLNSFTFRQISSKVNTMVMSMTVICLMLFVTICTLSAAFSIRNSMNYNLRQLCPADFELEAWEYRDGEYRYADIMEMCENADYDLTAHFGDYVHFHSYHDDSFVLRDSLGEHLEEIQKNYRYINYESAEVLIKLSDYNALMKLYGREPLSLGENEFILLCDFKNMKAIRDEALSVGMEIHVLGRTLKSKYGECQDGFIDISSQHTNVGIYIIPDSVADESSAWSDSFIGNYNASTKEEKAAMENKVTKEFEAVKTQWREGKTADEVGKWCNLNTKLDIAEATVGLGAIVTFLGLYIGLVFLIACGAILALKELSESVDSIGRYTILRKIGAEESDISKSLFCQIGVFFLLPLLLACLHSVFGMKFGMYLLEIFGTEKLTESVFSTSLVILLIYGGYFLITYFCSRSIIKEQR